MTRERTPCVYILASGPRGTIYIGVTSDLPGRLFQHRNGITGGFVHEHRVYRLVWYEVAECMESAIAREKQLKRWHRDWKLNLIERQNPEWNDLAPRLGIAEPLPQPPPSC
ncbi:MULTISPECIES: GIY-YIG nuclease family protein [unclassified Sphingomonas]|uniref:GIY-YIG nuclease family protein n=1 Tax=unclassified Sphingomonas TaxID=196159 RepID=UPI0022B56C04|nr:GIY-YIG nuclease family protein [Sphingomonas sp. NIBR02145]WHU01150.1 GIY-YIG nuclease family protein [Sphingomonas sp. NIBR02145]